MKILKWQQFNENKSKNDQIKEITDKFDKEKDHKEKTVKEISDKFDKVPEEDKDEDSDGFSKYLKNKYGKKKDKI